MSTRGLADSLAIDLVRDVPTTAEDVKASGRLRRETPSWFSLTPTELEALIPQRRARPAGADAARRSTVYAALTR